MILRTD